MPRQDAQGRWISDDGLQYWDGTAWREARALKGHTQQVYAVAFAPDGKTLASAGGSFPEATPGEIKLWDVPPAERTEPARSAALSGKDLDGLWDALSEDDAVKPFRRAPAGHGIHANQRE